MDAARSLTDGVPHHVLSAAAVVVMPGAAAARAVPAAMPGAVLAAIMPAGPAMLGVGRRGGNAGGQQGNGGGKCE